MDKHQLNEGATSYAQVIVLFFKIEMMKHIQENYGLWFVHLHVRGNFLFVGFIKANREFLRAIWYNKCDYPGCSIK